MPDLRPLRVAQTTSQLLQAKHLKQQPVWLPTVSRIPPSSDISRKVLPSFGSTTRPSKSKKVKRVFEPQRIRYVEDKLRARFYKEHPWELARPVLLVENDGLEGNSGGGGGGRDWSRMDQVGKIVSGESVVQRLLYMMREGGKSRDEAYLLACREFYAIRGREAIEKRIVVEEALSFGAQFDKSATQVGLELEAATVAEWREKAIAAKNLVQPVASVESLESGSSRKNKSLIKTSPQEEVAEEEDVLDDLLSAN